MSSELHSGNAAIQRSTEQDYRPLVDLWTTVFEVPAIVFEAMYESADPSTRFGFFVRDGDLIVSAVQTYVLPLRDEKGTPQPVACIANVSTRPEYRKRGHSSALLKATIAEAEARGCAWSYLFTGVPDFYAKLGWRNVHGEVVSLPVEGPARHPHGVTVSHLSELSKISHLHSKAHEKTPLAMPRGANDWDIKIPSRIAPRLVALIPGEAYAVLKEDGTKLTIDEWSVPGDSDKHYEDLLSAALNTARERGLGEVRLNAPITPGASSAIESLGGARRLEDGMGMARPISAEWTDERLAAMFALPEARFSNLDTF